MTKEIVTTTRLTNDELRALTPSNIAGFFAQRQTQIVDLSAELGSGFAVLEDKSKLLGDEFIIVEWHFSQGDKGEFVSLTVLTKDGRKLIVNDGSTGIRDQVKDLELRGLFAPVLVSGGLRVSEYYYDETKGEKFKHKEREDLSLAKTFYLSI